VGAVARMAAELDWFPIIASPVSSNRELALGMTELELLPV
jgi:hypothetical protein